jgi:excinuclease ABC subunit B
VDPSPKPERKRIYTEPEKIDYAADPVVKFMGADALKKAIDKAKKSMEEAAKQLDFIQAARFRDEMYALQKQLDSLKH